MCPTHINAHIQELAKLRAMRSELEELIAHEEQELKQFMSSNELTELIGLEHKVTYKPVITTRVDTTELKRKLPEVAAQFMKSSSTMRFTIV
jgi:predicted phage-related endonuclease